MSSNYACSLKLHSEYPALRSAIESVRVDAPPDPDVLEADHGLQQAWEVIQASKASPIDAADVLEELLRRSMKRYGEAPRDVYEGIFDKGSVDGEIDTALKRLTLETLVLAMYSMASPGAWSFQMTGLHTLLSLDVRSTLPSSNDHFVPKFKSVPIAELVLKQYAHLKYEQAKLLFDIFRGNPQSSITAGWIFEGLVHGVLCGQISPASATLCGPLVAMPEERGGTAPRFVTEQEFDLGTQRLPIRPRSYTVVDLGDATFASAPHDSIENSFYVPKAANNPLFDSFFVELKTDPLTAVVWIFQVTTAKDRKGSPQGYRQIDAIRAAAVARAQVYAPEHPPAQEEQINVRQPDGDVNVELNYVLVCPEPKQRVSWNMPEGWLSRRGKVFCQFIDFTVGFHKLYHPSGLTTMIRPCLIHD